MVESVDQVVEPSRGEELLAVGRPYQPGESAREGDPADRPAVGAVNHQDLVLAVSGVEDRQDRLAGVHGDLDGKVSQLRLTPGRLERPAVGEEDRPGTGHPRPGRRFLDPMRIPPALIGPFGRMIGRHSYAESVVVVSRPVADRPLAPTPMPRPASTRSPNSAAP